MKKTFFCFLLSLTLLFSLVACNYADKNEQTTEPTHDWSGTLYISVNPVIAVTYDIEGNVTDVVAVTDDAKHIVDGYRDYIGKDCTQVLTELVTVIGESGYLSKDLDDVTISIRFEDSSAMPGDDFVETVTKQLQDVVETNQWQGNVIVEEPKQASSSIQTDPSTEPVTSESTTESTYPDGVPENALQQDDGTFVLTEYVDINDKPVENDPYYIRTTYYNETGAPVRQERVTAENGSVNRMTTWEYDETGLCVSLTEIQYFSTGAVKLHYCEEYDAAGQLEKRTNYDKDGEISGILSCSYYENGTLKLEDEVNSDGILVAQREYSESGSMLTDSRFYADGTPQSLTTYNEDGIRSSVTNWQEDGVMRYYEEFYPSGNCKLWKRWQSSGVLDQEFIAFSDDNSGNGIHTAYDGSGNMTYRDSIGNPDGSPDTTEIWDADGAYIVMSAVDGQTVEERYSYPDGGSLIITYDWEAGTMHAVGQRSYGSWDRISHIGTDEPIEGYSESTYDGIYTRIDWVDGYKYREISDGGVNHAGYAYRGTTYYYPSGAVMAHEMYFYADGGRTYNEYDESGNETYSEDTTKCND